VARGHAEERVGLQMNIEIAQSTGREVAEKWRSQYHEKDGQWKRTVSGDSAEIYEQLLLVGDDPAKIAEIIGNKGWSYLHCDGCSTHVLIAVRYGDYDTSTVRLCKNCLASASAAINAVSQVLGR
jgi:hypothetical protein